METISENACFGGVQGVYRHRSDACGCDMTFAVFMPPQAARGPVPVLWYLSGLTCTHENAMTKAGAQAWAAETARTGPVVKILTPNPMPTATRARFFPGEDRGKLAEPKAEAARLLAELQSHAKT